MIVVIALAVGALVGWRRAKALGGGAKDVAQYAAVHAVIFGLLGLFATILVERLA